MKNDYIDSKSPFALSSFSNLVFDYLSEGIHRDKNIVILCIGTDRSTGDSLGPLVGHKLQHMIKDFHNVELLGTLKDPVHALNLEDTINSINKRYEEPFILAVDSSLGRYNRVGYLSVKNFPLKPGAGVNKVLPSVGDVSITGIVNVAGIMELMVLQNTRLSLVMTMADIISKSIYLSLLKVTSKQKDLYMYKN